MTVHFHEEDLPPTSSLPGVSIAVDTETMGLITPRDRLCVVQLSDGGPDEHLVRFGARPATMPRQTSRRCWAIRRG